jgi:alpha-tubulin suppressor-like RCC1 family protein
MQISAGVDISMAVSTTGDVYSWGKTGGGRIGLNTHDDIVRSPQKVDVKNSKGNHVKAVDVECGYVHSMIVGCDGSLYMCGGVGTDGDEDGQKASEIVDGRSAGKIAILGSK